MFNTSLPGFIISLPQLSCNRQNKKTVSITSQKKYHVRFTAGQRLHQKIPFKNVASMDPIDPNELEIGSRVVGELTINLVSAIILQFARKSP